MSTDGLPDEWLAPLMLSSRARAAMVFDVRRAADAAAIEFPFDERAEAIAVVAISGGRSPEEALEAVFTASGTSTLPDGVLRARSTYERLYAGSLPRDVPGWTLSTAAAVVDAIGRDRDPRYAARIAWVLERLAADAEAPRWSAAHAPDLWLSYDAVPSAVRIFGPVLPDEPIVLDGSFGVPVRSSWMVVPSDTAGAVVTEAMEWARVHWVEAYAILGGATPLRSVRAIAIEAFVRGLTIPEGVDLALERTASHSSEDRVYFECVGHLLGTATIVNARVDVRSDVLAELARTHDDLIPVREGAQRVIATLRGHDALAFDERPERDGWLRSAAELASERRPHVPFARFRADLEVFRDLGETPAAAVESILSVGLDRPVRLPVKPPNIELGAHGSPHG